MLDSLFLLWIQLQHETEPLFVEASSESKEGSLLESHEKILAKAPGRERVLPVRFFLALLWGIQRVATARFLCRGFGFFVTINLRQTLAPLSPAEYAHVAEAMSESRQRLGFLLLGYVLMPDHWHALIWPAFPLTISRVVQDVKWLSARSLNRGRKASGPVWQAPVLGPLREARAGVPPKQGSADLLFKVRGVSHKATVPRRVTVIAVCGIEETRTTNSVVRATLAFGARHSERSEESRSAHRPPKNQGEIPRRSPRRPPRNDIGFGCGSAALRVCGPHYLLEYDAVSPNTREEPRTAKTAVRATYFAPI